MIKHNIRIFASTILFLAFGVYTIIFFCTQNIDSIDFNKAFSHISTTISINIIIWIIFISWGWKCRIFYPWLVQTPNLSGNWSGILKSNWKAGDIEPIPIDVKIKQDFFNITIKITTAESRSHSISSSFNIDQQRDYKQLFYSYLNTPKSGIRERSSIHYGSVLLNFDGFKVREMSGEYWTSRETTGEIELIKEM